MKLDSLTYKTVFLMLCAALAACSDQDVPVNPEPVPETVEKTPIELSASYSDVSEQEAMTRAVITDGTGKTLNAFKKSTSLYMLMKSDHDVQTNPGTSKVTRTIMFAVGQTDGTKNFSEVNYSGDLANPKANEYSKFVRFWDDTYGRESAISILAVCTPGLAPSYANGTNDSKTWKIGGSDNGYTYRPWDPIAGGGGSTPYESIVWPVGFTTEQAKDQSGSYSGLSFIDYEDLCYSNNIGKFDSYDQRLKFDTSTKKFSTGILKFYHALSKLTFRIKKGDGFNDTEFTFKENTNIKLSNFYNYGTFDIQNGAFLATPIKADINKIHACTPTSDESAAGYKYILDALVIPGTDMTSATDNAVTFYINNNEYKLSMAQLYAAFNATQKTGYFDSNKLKAGVHYVFTLTVGKTKIQNLTASVVGWEDVVADEINPSNARINIQLEERGTDLLSTDQVAIYRAEDNASDITDSWENYNWTTGYGSTSNIFKKVDGVWKLSTDWYWNSNVNYYHFRALMPDETSVNTDSDNGDYAPLQSGENYTDVRWGAPMRDVANNEASDNFKFIYNASTGFNVVNSSVNTSKSQIYQAIGPTSNALKLTLFHMMSDLTFNIKTTSDASKVELCHNSGESYTKLDLVGFYKNGKVLLGTGLVKTDGSISTVDNRVNISRSSIENGQYAQQQYTFGAVPQDLTAVKLYITTPDKNQYIVDLKDVKATTIATNNIENPYTKDNGKYKIDRWYPGFKYVYTFTLAKSGITNLQATIVDWETVTAEDDTVTIQ